MEDVSRSRGLESVADMGPTIIVTSAIGGAGKTTYTLALAQRAAEVLSKVSVIEMGHASDIQKYLRLPESMLPGNVDDSHLTSDQVNVHRPGLPEVKFDSHLTVPIPINQMLDANRLIHLIADVSRESDLTVVDREIAVHGSLEKEIINQYHAAGGGETYYLIIVGEAAHEIESMKDSVAVLRGLGVDTSHILVSLNRFGENKKVEKSVEESVTSAGGTYVGSTLFSAQFTSDIVDGNLPGSHEYISTVTNVILSHVVGREEFATVDSKPRLGFLKGLFAKGGE